MLFIHMSNKHLLLLSFLLCLLISVIGASITSSNEKKMDRLISNICDELYNNDESDAIENSKWEHLCRSWLQLYGRDQQNKEEMIDEVEKSRMFQLRRGGSSGSRGGGSRASSSSSRSSSSRTSGSRTSGSRTSGSRTSSITSYRSSRTGARISRPVGHMWSRTRHTFLPISTRFAHRSRTSNTRYTTPATGTITYYYCTSSINSTNEIQCTSETGDNQCCEDETSNQPFCCGGKISDDLIEDFNKAAQQLAKLFYTLAAVILVLYVFRRRRSY